jgi:4-phytase / acid phosphatase
MRLRVLVFVVLALLLAQPAAAQLLPIPPGWQMERAILLSRHGVRSPLQSPEEMQKYAAQPWPTWPVAPGDLTPRGEELMRLMGRFYHVLYGGRGLVQADDCPPRATVAAWTDVDQRTRLTGKALLNGMYPGCGNPRVNNQADLSAPDPLFHPGPSASCPMDPATNRAAVLERIGGDFSLVLREYAPQLTLMQSILCPPGGVAAGTVCGLQAEPSDVKVGRHGWVNLTGPIAIGAKSAETFLMEASDGMPADQVAWGRLSNDAQLTDLLKIHRLEFDLAQKTLPIARERGSNLLSVITAALQDGHKFPGLPAGAEPVRLGFLVGHDSNIANIARLLNLGWQIPGFQPNEPSPGGALAFEMLRDVHANRRYVRLAYYAQTLDQMRSAQPLDARRHPGMVAVDLPGCESDLHLKSCPLERFVEIAGKALDPGCVTVRP